MKSLQTAASVATIAILFLLIPSGLRAAQNPDSAAVSQLLQSVKTHAANAEDDAATLASFTRSTLDKRHHGVQLNMIREHINNLIRDGNELNSKRDEGSPWQQQAIDHIVQLLPVMADHLTATITYLNEHPNHVNLKPFQDYVLANETLIHNAHDIISAYVEYGEAKAKSETLEKNLRLPPAAEPTA